MGDAGVAIRYLQEHDSVDLRTVPESVLVEAMDDLCRTHICADPRCWFCRKLRKKAAIASVSVELEQLPWKWPQP